VSILALVAAPLVLLFEKTLTRPAPPQH
jgi:hypothetical protein